MRGGPRHDEMGGPPFATDRNGDHCYPHEQSKNLAADPVTADRLTSGWNNEHRGQNDPGAGLTRRPSPQGAERMPRPSPARNALAARPGAPPARETRRDDADPSEPEGLRRGPVRVRATNPQTLGLLSQSCRVRRQSPPSS